MMLSRSLPLLLGAALLLASCGSSPGTGNGGSGGGSGGGNGSGGGGTTPGTPGVVSRTVTLGLPDNTGAEVLIPATLSSRVTAQLASAPGGLSVTVGTPAQLSTGDTQLPITYSGDAGPGSVVKITLTVSGTSSTVELPVVKFSAQPIQTTGLSGTYLASSLRFQADGSALLSAAQNADVTARHALVKVDAAGTTFSLLNLPIITQFGDSITSHAVGSDGTAWMTVRGMTAEGSYVLSRDPAGNVKKYLVGASGDNLNNVTLQGGRVWFTQYTRAAVRALTPSSGDVQSYAVPEKADSLITGADGNLYYASFYARPAIMQLNPGTGSSQAFNVGEANRSLPTSLRAAPDGSVWFIESLTSTVWQLRPGSGKQTQLTLPAGVTPDALAVNASSQVWVSDASNARLYAPYTRTDGVNTTVGIATPTGGAHALAISPTGKAWFEAGGKLYVQQ